MVRFKEVAAKELKDCEVPSVPVTIVWTMIWRRSDGHAYRLDRRFTTLFRHRLSPVRQQQEEAKRQREGEKLCRSEE